MSKYIWACTLLIFASWAKSAFAETLTVIEPSYTPLIERRGSQIASCGIHFSAALQGPESGYLGFQGSINFFYPDPADGYLPYFAGKGTLIRAENGEISRIKINSLAFQGRENNTFELEQLDGQDGSKMLVGTMADFPNLFSSFGIETGEGLRIFLNIDENRNDLSFKLPNMIEQKDSKQAFGEFSRCDIDGMEQVQKSLEKFLDERE